MVEPKFQRPGKPGHIWPGVYKIPKSYPADAQKHPWHFNCPAPLCFYRGAYTDELAARRIQETHPCPWFGGGTTTLSWGIMSDMFLAPIWKKLDEVMNQLMLEKMAAASAAGATMVEEHNREILMLQNQARGMAEALAILMPPFFSTGDEIAQEALVRWQARQKGEDYETPGIGRLRFAVPPGAERMTPSGMTHASVAGTKYAPEYHPSSASKNHGLTDEQVAAIMTGYRSGFPARMLAMAQGVDENIVNRVIQANAKA